jgi:flagellar motor protein MotB
VRFRHRRTHELEEGESYYVSMTDMMVGVVFIFIIMLSYFALNYRQSTQSLTSAKDAQTQVLLKMATALEHRDVALDIDRQHHVVCIPAAVLADDGVPDTAPHCFAYSTDSAAVAAAAAAPSENADAEQAAFMASVGQKLDADKIVTKADPAKGTLTFTSDQLFEDNRSTLSPAGQTIINSVAAMLAAQLPCYAYDAPAKGCANTGKMAQVNIASRAGLDLYTEAGREEQNMALERSVAFHDALIAAAPVLGKLNNAQGGGHPLLAVSALAQSGNGDEQVIAIQFRIAK